MSLLVFNAGSTSIKFAVFDMGGAVPLARAGGELAPVQGDGGIVLRHGGGELRRQVRTASVAAAVAGILALLRETAFVAAPPSALAHRVVSGESGGAGLALVDEGLLRRLEARSALAPLHEGLEVAVMRAASAALGANIPAYAAFDSAFFSGLPEAAKRYAIPARLSEGLGIRRLGYHGLAHRSMLAGYGAASGRPLAGSRLISFQLGGGASMAACADGQAVDISMGYTPLEGLVMATRCGDIDAGAIFACIAAGMRPAELHETLEQHSGLLGLSGLSADPRVLLQAEAGGHAGARLALELYCQRARKYLGGGLATLGGADAVLFGGGIGEHQAEIRKRICAGFGWCGLELDPAANLCGSPLPRRISTPASRIAVYVTPVDEAGIIASDVLDHSRSRAAGHGALHG
jgi:acetate kinase